MVRLEQIKQKVLILSKDVSYWHSIFKDSRGPEEVNAKKNRQQALSEMSQLRTEAYDLAGGASQIYQEIDSIVAKAYSFNSR